MGMCGRNCEAIRKELNLDFIVATNRSAIVATIEPIYGVGSLLGEHFDIIVKQFYARFFA
jgi:hypothetical protein